MNIYKIIIIFFSCIITRYYSRTYEIDVIPNIILRNVGNKTFNK